MLFIVCKFELLSIVTFSLKHFIISCKEDLLATNYLGFDYLGKYFTFNFETFLLDRSLFIDNFPPVLYICHTTALWSPLILIRNQQNILLALSIMWWLFSLLLSQFPLLCCLSTFWLLCLCIILLGILWASGICRLIFFK